MRKFLILILVLIPVSSMGQESPNPQWPNIMHRAGPYDIHESEIQAAVQAGFPFFVNGYFPETTAFYADLKKHNLRYIDSSLWGIVADACRRRTKNSKESKPACQLTPEDEKSILSEVQKHLEATQNDPLIIGYWILDDYNYAGSVAGVLEKIHALVAEANGAAVIRRPTICGLGAALDYKNKPSDSAFHYSHGYFRNAVNNFSPHACDMVALYNYGENKIPDPDAIDWSMSALLPYQTVVLKKHGWDPARRPLIGITQTFSYPWKPGKTDFVEPRYQDIVTQTEAYCKAGASAIFFYAWDDSVSDPNKHQVYNTPYMLRGIQDGISICSQRYWSGK